MAKQLNQDISDEDINVVKLTSHYNMKDLKIQCIIRGIDFDQVVSSDFPNLSMWLLRNRNNEQDESLLKEFDDHVESLLKEHGKEYLIHPSLRLSYVSDSTDGREHKMTMVPTKEKKEKTTKVGVSKKEKDKNGIIKHTKKSLTFKLQKKGYNVDKVIKRVCRRFPDANVKSIKIWFKKSERLSKRV